jgi:hypothetical protein
MRLLKNVAARLYFAWIILASAVKLLLAVLFNL